MSIQLNSAESESKQDVQQDAKQFPKNFLNPPYKKQDKSLSSLFHLLTHLEPSEYFNPLNVNTNLSSNLNTLKEISHHSENAITTMTWGLQAIASLMFGAASNKDYPLNKDDIADISMVLHLLSDGIDTCFVTKENADFLIGRNNI